MTYTLKTSRSFQKDFEVLDSLMQSRLLVVLERMKVNPFEDVKKLKNVEVGIYRKRIGDYRLRFDVFKKQREIYLYRIRHRKEVYRD